ncbi:Aste57867_16200 [Aphanomyces stellatus]|uniref:Aste57867_16200 protein n=1 Tax=Aphanomyces stellatus TaxID=120398 RepID=A0A485L837_9STRA|nr:hypothetical protein As57867_016144 [Aphanomyces stellatus]VFT92978.1 Aste57867_16200 [Aphanomyces stellatus]
MSPSTTPTIPVITSLEFKDDVHQTFQSKVLHLERAFDAIDWTEMESHFQTPFVLAADVALDVFNAVFVVNDDSPPCFRYVCRNARGDVFVDELPGATIHESVARYFGDAVTAGTGVVKRGTAAGSRMDPATQTKSIKQPNSSDAPNHSTLHLKPIPNGLEFYQWPTLVVEVGRNWPSRLDQAGGLNTLASSISSASTLHPIV